MKVQLGLGTTYLSLIFVMLIAEPANRPTNFKRKLPLCATLSRQLQSSIPLLQTEILISAAEDIRFNPGI